MKRGKKILLVAALLCLLPFPRKVECDAENIVIDGIYFDFLFLRDRFVGEAKINGLDYKAFSDYSASKLPAKEGVCYMIGFYRHNPETNRLDTETLYLKENLKELEYVYGKSENDSKVTVVENETKTELYEFQTFGKTYENGNWLNWQGLRASIELPNIADKLSEVTWDEDVKIQISEDVELYYIIVFDENYEGVSRYSKLEELQAFCTVADEGSYYVAIAVNWDGEYIPSEEECEKYGSEFVFEVLK